MPPGIFADVPDRYFIDRFRHVVNLDAISHMMEWVDWYGCYVGVGVSGLILHPYERQRYDVQMIAIRGIYYMWIRTAPDVRDETLQNIRLPGHAAMERMRL